jgi:hypothetical protein
MTILNWASLLLIVGTLIGVAVGRYPWLRMNRATIALAGNLTLGTLTLGVLWLSLVH